jgi:hypothetical protein
MFAELAQYVYPKRNAVELAADPAAPQQSKLVVEFVRARPARSLISAANRILEVNHDVGDDRLASTGEFLVVNRRRRDWRLTGSMAWRLSFRKGLA